MTRVRVATALGLLAFALPALVAAQGLGDAAAREKAKREAARKAGGAKVFTNDDLAQGRPPGTPKGEAPGPSGSPSTSSPAGVSPERASEEPAPGPDRRAEEQGYTDAETAAKARVAEVEARIQQLQAKLNPMSNSFIYGAFGSNSTTEEGEVRAELTQAEAELSGARQAAVEAAQAHQDFRQGRPGGPPLPQ